MLERRVRLSFLARTCLALAVSLQISLAAADGSGQNDQTVPCDRCGFVETVIADTADVFTASARWHKPEWRSAAIKAAAVAGSMLLLDEHVRDYVQDHRNDTTDRIANAFEPFGAEYSAGVLGGFALIGHFADKPVAMNLAFDGTASLFISAGLIVPGLKFVTGRSRPNADLGSSDFNPFGGAESFPSGHTAAAFAVAASIATHYDKLWVKGLSYGVAGLVGYSRMVHDAHWLSDVTAGAFIGIGVAREVSKLNLERRGVVLVPFHEQGTWGIRLAKTF
jgi:hypothetical protein